MHGVTGAGEDSTRARGISDYNARPVPMSTQLSPGTSRAGGLPPWSTADLPAPPPFTCRNVLRVIGPGAILLATAIGGGEWLVGPAAAVKYGATIMGIATIAIVLQLVFNLEAIRYTLYTGEPIYTGFMRLAPGPTSWAVIYVVLTLVQLGWPALALTAGATVFSMGAGRLPGSDPGDVEIVRWLAIAIVAVVALLLLFGGTVERMLEYASWSMLVFIFTFLIVANVVFVPASDWWRTFQGFFTIRSPGGVIDWGLLGALAATAGSGGVGNLTITNWIRDKGFGMGGCVGAIESAVGGRHAPLSPIGVVFPVTTANLLRWHGWWRYVLIDQVIVWALFCGIGIFLTVNLATSVVPPGSDMQGLATGAYQAQYMASHLWRGFWVLTLLNGFWILFSTHLGNTDLLVRTVTDLTWTGSATARRWTRGRASLIYYAVLAAFSCWAVYTMRLAGPFALFKVMANVAGLVMAIAGVQILIVNRRFLPRALRPPLYREVLLGFCVLFYGFFSVRVAIHSFW
jgi:hypothetical protein